MGLCRGNRGNLMQHWVLCDLLGRLAQRHPARPLLLACSHSMAPWSVPERRMEDGANKCREIFTAVRRRLAEERPSRYEEAWCALSVGGGLPYPSSAAFTQHVWTGPLSLLLCEAAKQIADEIDGWLGTSEIQTRCMATALHRGDWRQAFRTGLPVDGAGVILIEMDPMRFEHHGPDQCSRKDGAVLFPEDLDLVENAVRDCDCPVVIQISSFSANNGNSHAVVERTILDRLQGCGFGLDGRATVGGQMISLVLTRGIHLYEHSNQLELSFGEWLGGAI